VFTALDELVYTRVESTTTYMYRVPLTPLAEATTLTDEVVVDPLVGEQIATVEPLLQVVVLVVVDGAETVTVLLADAVAPALSVTVRVTV
jgi:hypothetical protein